MPRAELHRTRRQHLDEPYPAGEIGMIMKMQLLCVAFVFMELNRAHGSTLLTRDAGCGILRLKVCLSRGLVFS